MFVKVMDEDPKIYGYRIHTIQGERLRLDYLEN